MIIISLVAIIFTGCSKKKVVQKELPSKGETVAEIHLKDIGSVQVRLFDSLAPSTVENFVKLVKSGYYNNSRVSMLVPGYLVKTEGAAGEASGALSDGISVESSEYLKPIRGAVCMDLASEGTNSASSFFILLGTGSDITELDELLDYKETDLSTYLKYGYEMEFSEEQLDYYRLNGGAPWLEGHHSIFGQVYSGLDIVDTELEKIDVSRDGYYAPVEDVIIESIEIFTVAE